MNTVGPMRVLLVIDSLGSGGAQRQLVNLALGLKRRGHLPELFVYYPQYAHFAPRVEREGVPIHAYAKSWRFSLGPVLALRRLLLAGSYEAVVAFLPTPSLYAEVATRGLAKLRTVVAERISYPNSRLTVGQWWRVQSHRAADSITVNSHSQRAEMEKRFPWMRGKISTIYNGIDLVEFRPSHGDAQESGSPLRLLAVGTVIERKNAANVVRALDIYRRRYGDPPIVRWAGKIDGGGSGARAWREANVLIQRLRLEPCWEWLGEVKDVAGLLRQHDALIHASFLEGLPNAICEGLASGLPVLASDACDHPRLVQDGVRGFLFDPRDPGSIAGAMRRLAFLSPCERSELGRNGRLFAEEALSLEAFVGAYEALLTRLIQD